MKRVAKCECGKVHKRFKGAKHLVICDCGRAARIMDIEPRRKRPVFDKVMRSIAPTMWAIGG